MQIQYLNDKIPEGKLLMAALSILTTTESLYIMGKPVNGCKQTPDEMLEHLHKVSDEMFASNVISEDDWKKCTCKGFYSDPECPRHKREIKI